MQIVCLQSYPHLTHSLFVYVCSIWRHPKVQQNPKTIALTLTLLGFGIVSFGGGVCAIVEQMPVMSSVLFILSLVTGLPGGSLFLYAHTLTRLLFNLHLLGAERISGI